MGAGRRIRNRDGITLVEIAIAVAILGILAALAITSFGEMREKYAIETETKNFYAAMMEARGRASQRSRHHFVRITSGGFAVFEDTGPSPDGDGAYVSGADNQVINETTKHAIAAFLLPASATGDNVIFDRRGISNVTGYVRFANTPGSSANPDYNCVTIRETRLRTGKMNATDNNCIEK